MTTTRQLPHWDMTVVYPNLDSPAFNQAFSQAIQDINDLASLFDTHHIQEQPAPNVDDRDVQSAETIIARLNTILEQHTTLFTYINCFVDTNSHDTLAQARLSEFQNALTLLSQLLTRFTAWIGSLDVESIIERSPLAREHTYMLRQAQQQARHLMSSPEEELAAELNVSSGNAWARLHSNITSQLAVPLEIDGQTRDYPMTEIRNMAFSPNRDLRRQAYEAELAGWQRTAVPLAAALNSIKNETNILCRRRKWSSPLDASLFMNSIDRATLDAMLSAARASFPDFRRYLQTKARLLGLPRLAWYDIDAPVVETDQVWEYDDAVHFIVEQFGTYSPRLSQFAARAFREHWIDAEPRPGKVGGAYCTEIMADQSRILANFTPSYSGMSTLAHELGHAYHNLNLVQRSPLQRILPMTLAETASIFCETIIRQAALRTASKQGQIAILEASLQDACQIVVDITSRFLFEQNVFEKRKRLVISTTIWQAS